MLRTLEITAQSLYSALVTGSLSTASSLKHALLTIESPAFSEVIVCYSGYDIYALGEPPAPRQPPQTIGEEMGSRHHMLFDVFYEMHRVRDFKLVLHAYDVFRWRGEWIRVLERVVATERAEGRLDRLSSQPLVTISPWGSCPAVSQVSEHTAIPVGGVRAWARLWHYDHEY